MRSRMGRLLAIAVVVTVTVAFAWWLGGPDRRLGPFLPEPPALRVEDGVQGTAAVPPFSGSAEADVAVPLWPEGVELLDKARLDRAGMRGGVFSVALGDRDKVLQFYRDLFVRMGWHELPADDGAGLAKMGLSAQDVKVFTGRSGTFFLGWSKETEAAHFVAVHAAREGD